MSRVFLLASLTEVPGDAPVLRADDLGVLRGESVFETLRISTGRPAFLEDHLTRFAASAARLDIALPSGFSALALMAAEGVQDASLRLVCSKGVPGGAPVGFAVVSDIDPAVVAGRTSGVRVVTLPLGISASLRTSSPWLLGGVKSTSYAVNMSALRHAHALGAGDAIWTSTDGWVLEAPTATVIARVDGTWITPPASAGILPGTTLLAAQRVVTVAVRPLSVGELAGAAEVALLSSVRGIAPVVQLDDRVLGIGPATLELAQAYEALLHP